jgi:hypothetical protein
MSESHHGNFEERIAGDMKGKMWISVDEQEVVRAEFENVSRLTLGLGILGSVKTFQGFVEQAKVHGQIWLPRHQEFEAQGRQLIKGFRIRQISEFSDYLKATTDVFQQVQVPNTPVGESAKSQN